MSFDLNGFEFIESESYEKEDYEEEHVEEQKGKKDYKEFLNDTSHSGIAKKWLIIFLVLLYVLWSSVQYITALTNNIELSVLPHRVIMNVIGVNPTLALLTAIVAAVLASAITFALTKKIEDEQKEIRISKNITHGSAKFATENAMLGAVVSRDLDSPTGIVTGKMMGNPEILSEERYKSLREKSIAELERIIETRNALSNEAYEETKEMLAICVDNKVFDRNMNFAIYGPSGSGKSYSFVRPNILTRIFTGESFVVSDPSGELYRDTAAIAKKHGYNVKVINFKNFDCSNGWNPFDVLKSASALEIQTLTGLLAHTIMANTVDEDAKGDPFFDKNEENLLQALMLYVAVSPNFKGEEHERHMGTVYDLLTKCAAQEGILEEFAELPNTDPAKAPWQLFQGSGRLKQNFITGLASRIEIFQTDMVKEMFSHSEVNLSALGQEKCAYYILSSVLNTKTIFLMSLFFSCVFEQLISDAEASLAGKTKIPVFFILDEFKAIGKINGFADKVANVRKYGISLAIIFQDLGQLKQAYPKSYQSILSNCDTTIIMGVNDTETAKEVSEIMGITTVESETEQHQQLKRTPITPVDPMLRIGKSDQRRSLMNPDEVRKYFDDMGTNQRRILLLCKSKPPLKLKSYPWTDHCLAKYVKENQLNALDYVPPWQKEEWTLNKKRTFLGTDNNNSSELTYAGKSKERDEYKEKVREQRVEETAQDKAKKKTGGVIFNSDAKSSHLVELGLDLSGKKKV